MCIRIYMQYVEDMHSLAHDTIRFFKLLLLKKLSFFPYQILECHFEIRISVYDLFHVSFISSLSIIAL